MEENEKKNELEKNDNSNENQQLQNNNQKSKSNLIIIVLLVVIAGLLAFIGYDKVFNADTKKENNQQEGNKDNKDNDSQKEEKPKDAIYNLPDGIISENNEDLIKYHAIYKATDYVQQSYLESLSKGVIETLSDDDVNMNKIGFVITKIKPVRRSCSLINLNLDDDYFCGNSTDEILTAHSKNDKEKVKMLESKNETDTYTKEEVDSKEKEIFGEVLVVPKDNIVGYEYGAAYIYDSKSNLIAMHTIQAGGTSPNVFEETITSANKTGDLLTIESKQSVSWGEMSTEAPKINKVILTLKWKEEVGRYVFYSRESYEQ